MKKILTNALIAFAVSIPLAGLIFVPNALYATQFNPVLPYASTIVAAFVVLVIFGLWAYRRNLPWINQKNKFLRAHLVILITLLFTFPVFWNVWNLTSRYYYVRLTGDDSVSYFQRDWYAHYAQRLGYCWVYVAVLSTILIYGVEGIARWIRSLRQQSV